MTMIEEFLWVIRKKDNLIKEQSEKIQALEKELREIEIPSANSCAGKETIKAAMQYKENQICSLIRENIKLQKQLKGDAVEISSSNTPRKCLKNIN